MLGFPGCVAWAARGRRRRRLWLVTAAAVAVVIAVHIARARVDDGTALHPIGAASAFFALLLGTILALDVLPEMVRPPLS